MPDRSVGRTPRRDARGHGRRRDAGTTLATLLALGLAGPPAIAAPEGVGANGPVAIDGTIPPPAEAPSDPGPDADVETRDAAEAETPDPPPASDWTPPERERRRLGAPRFGDADASVAPEPAPADETADAASDDVPMLDVSGLSGFAEPLRVGGALVVVVVLILLLRLGLRRAARAGGVLGGHARPSGVLEVLARYPFARGETLVLLRLARRVILVHHAHGRMEPLLEVDDPDEVARLLGRLEAGANDKDAKRFRAVLDRLESEHDEAAQRFAPPTEPVRGRAARPARAEDGVPVVDLTRGRAAKRAGAGGVLARLRRSA